MGKFFPTVWYNQAIESIIFSKDPIQPSSSNFGSLFANLIRNPFDTIKTAIQSSINEPVDQSYVNSITKFNKLYISKQGSREIRGTVEGKLFKNLVVEYKGFSTNICTFITLYNTKKSDGGSGIECSNQGGTYYVLAQGLDTTKIDPDTIWNDLTSKLRI